MGIKASRKSIISLLHLNSICKVKGNITSKIDYFIKESLNEIY